MPNLLPAGKMNLYADVVEELEEKQPKTQALLVFVCSELSIQSHLSELP